MDIFEKNSTISIFVKSKCVSPRPPCQPIYIIMICMLRLDICFQFLLILMKQSGDKTKMNAKNEIVQNEMKSESQFCDNFDAYLAVYILAMRHSPIDAIN